MIARVWHGWTTPANAEAYETLLRTEIFPGIRAKALDRLHRLELFRRDLGSEVEFMTILSFTSLDAVKALGGADYEVAYVPENARAVLSRFDARAQHYEMRS